MKLFASLFVGAILAAAPTFATVETGQPAPDFKLTGIDGHAHRLSDYKGKIVVLEWNNPDCPIVHKHYDSGNIPALQRAATGQGVVWLLINSAGDGEQGAETEYSNRQIAAWLKAHQARPTAYLWDPHGEVGHLYQAKTTPHMFVINADGVLVYDGAIDSIRSSDPADIPHAENYVKEALAAVEAGRPVAKARSQPYGCAVHYGRGS